MKAIWFEDARAMGLFSQSEDNGNVPEPERICIYTPRRRDERRGPAVFFNENSETFEAKPPVLCGNEIEPTEMPKPKRN